MNGLTQRSILDGLEASEPQPAVPEPRGVEWENLKPTPPTVPANASVHAAGSALLPSLSPAALPSTHAALDSTHAGYFPHMPLETSTHAPSVSMYAELKHVGNSAQAYGESLGGAQACGEAPACGENLEPDVLRIIAKHALTSTTDDYGKDLFSLARQLAPLGHDWDDKRWRAIVACWLVASTANGAVLEGFDKVYATFKRRQKIALKKPFGEMLERVKAARPLVIIPLPLMGGKHESVLRTMLALSEAHAQEGRLTWYGPFWAIAELSGGIDPKTAESRLAALANLGWVSLVEPGVPGTGRKRRASTWQVHSPPIPGKAVWNSNKNVARAATTLATTDSTPDADDLLDF